MARTISKEDRKQLKLIGRRIKNERIKQGLGIPTLSEITGITVANIYLLEQGE